MEHLLHPKDGKPALLRIRFHSRYLYKAGRFAEFPSTCGYSSKVVEERDFSSIPSSEYDAFFQAWLFFGLLYVFFGATVDDFVDQAENTVRVTRLPLYINKWQTRLYDVSIEEREVEFRRVSDVMYQAWRIVTRLDEPRSEDDSSVSEDIALSIYLLGETLLNAVQNAPSFRSIDDGRMFVHWPLTRYTRRCLKEIGWCETEIVRMSAFLGNASLIYCASLQYPGRVVDHSHCSDTRCTADNVIESQYTTAHDAACGTGNNMVDHPDVSSCKHAGPKIADLRSSLEQGSFPIIQLTAGSSSLDVEVCAIPYSYELPYTAITHV